MSKVFAIYPIDKSCSTSFLNRINTFETRKLGDIWHCYKVHFSDEDHERCIQQSKDSHFIFYMGHGGETQLHGACAKYGEMSVDIIAAKDTDMTAASSATHTKNPARSPVIPPNCFMLICL